MIYKHLKNIFIACEVYNTRTQACSGSIVSTRGFSAGCYGNRTYNTRTQACCNGPVRTRGFNTAR